MRHGSLRPIAESKSQFLHDSNEALSGFLHMLSHLENLEQEMLADLTEKGEAINRLKKSGLPAEDCNFNLVPGQPFVFIPEPASGSTN